MFAPIVSYGKQSHVLTCLDCQLQHRVILCHFGSFWSCYVHICSYLVNFISGSFEISGIKIMTWFLDLDSEKQIWTHITKPRWRARTRSIKAVSCKALSCWLFERIKLLTCSISYSQDMSRKAYESHLQKAQVKSPRQSSHVLAFQDLFSTINGLHAEANSQVRLLPFKPQRYVFPLLSPWTSKRWAHCARAAARAFPSTPRSPKPPGTNTPSAAWSSAWSQSRDIAGYESKKLPKHAPTRETR